MSSIGVVVARFYDDLAEQMEQQAREYATDREATIVKTINVAGVYDTPLAADRLARLDEVEAVVTLGVVISGDTDYDQVVTQVAAHQLSEISLERDTPVTFGVIGPGMSAAEARERITYGAEAMNAALDLVDELPN